MNMMSQQRDSINFEPLVGYYGHNSKYTIFFTQLAMAVASRKQNTSLIDAKNTSVDFYIRFLSNRDRSLCRILGVI